MTDNWTEDWAEDRENFTERGWDQFDHTTGKKDFVDQDTEYISAMLERMPVVSFGDYLRRYIHRKTGMTGAFDEIPLKEYQLTIRDCFRENDTPCSFTPTSAKMSALAKNWLTQRTVRRNVVFLLGFGLEMSVEEVNEALTKWLGERKINPKNPFEVICWYCYAHGYHYPKYEQLVQTCDQSSPDDRELQPVWTEESHVARSTVRSIHDEASLVRYVNQLKHTGADLKYGVTAKRHFDAMFEKAQAIIASLYNSVERDQTAIAVNHYREKLDHSDRVSDVEKQRRIEKLKAGEKIYRAKDITESDFEQVLCSAIPKDRNGNLSLARASSLNEQFKGYRFSRQHIWEIRNGNAEVGRSDLLTLMFFLKSQQLDELPDAKSRLYRFTEDCDKMLEDCSMGELYIQNPYECFLMMCMLSEDPLGTYADVVERSYQQNPSN